MMNTDVSHPSILANTAKTVVVPVNQEPIDSGIRLPVERITVDELQRRRRADAANTTLARATTPPPASVANATQAGTADTTQASAATPTLPSNVAVLQGMIVELRDALAGQKQRVAELEQGMNALLQRLLRKPRDVWPADQPSLFPEMQSPELRLSRRPQRLRHPNRTRRLRQKTRRRLRRRGMADARWKSCSSHCPCRSASIL